MIVIPNLKAESLSEAHIYRWNVRFGVCPFEIHCNQFRNFDSPSFGNLFDTLGINKTKLTTLLAFLSNGTIERYNRTLQNHQIIICDILLFVNIFINITEFF